MRAYKAILSVLFCGLACGQATNPGRVNVVTTPWSVNWLSHANDAAGLGDLGFSAFTQTLIGPANRDALFAAIGTDLQIAVSLAQDRVHDIRWYGALGEPADDTVAIQAAATAAAGGILLIPEGLYPISDTITVPANTQVVGSGPGAILHVEADVYALTLSGGSTSISNLTIDCNDTGKGIIADANHALLRVSDCNIVGSIGDAIVGTNLQKHGRIEVVRCTIRDCVDGIYFPGKYGSALIADNLIDTLTETGAVHGVHLGNNTLADRDEMLHAVVRDNVFLNITTTGVDSECHAIMVYGQRGLVSGNRIDTVLNDATSTAGGEALYVKLEHGQVVNNQIVDGGRSSNGAICSKSIGPVLIQGNLVTEEDTVSICGIYLGSSNIKVVDNILVGLSGFGISLGGADTASYSNVEIARNWALNNKGPIVILLEPAGGSNLRVKDNTIDGLAATDGAIANVYGIQMIAEDVDYNDVEISGNAFSDANTTAATSSVRCIYISTPDAASRILGLHLAYNTFAVVNNQHNVYGMYFAVGGPTPAITGLSITDNRAATMAGSAPASTVPIYATAADILQCELTAFVGNDFPGYPGLGAATISHDYAAGNVAWTMTAGEALASLFNATNASGAADAVFPVAVAGKVFTVYNNSGQIITWKVSGQAGSAVATGKRALFTMNATDCVEIYEQP